MAVRHLEVLTRRRRTQLTWLWPCDMKSKDGIPCCDCVIYINVLYIFYSVSSPYLLVFGDDRVRDTREQMTLQVDLVRLRAGAGLD